MLDLHHKFTSLASSPLACQWLKLQELLGLSPNTIIAYGRALEDFLNFCNHNSITPQAASKEHIALYVGDLVKRPNPRGKNVRVIDSGVGLSNATLQQKLTAVRLFYDYLIEEAIRESNPVGRGKYTRGKGFGGKRERGLIPRYTKLPWIPSDEQWQAILEQVLASSLRTRLMFAACYDAALRREELCSLKLTDIDPSRRLIHIRAETTKNRTARVVPYSEVTGLLYVEYLHHRRILSKANGTLFLSESHRNYAVPVSIWTWSKIINGISQRAGLSRFTTHTLRHLRLTDLARAGWDIHDIAQFAGHRSVESPLTYIHLSGRDLKDKLARGMTLIHERLKKFGE